MDSFQVMTEAEEIIDKGIMTGIEEDICLLDPNPEGIILQEAPITGRIINIIELTADSLGITAHPHLC